MNLHLQLMNLHLQLINLHLQLINLHLQLIKLTSTIDKLTSIVDKITGRKICLFTFQTHVLKRSKKHGQSCLHIFADVRARREKKNTKLEHLDTEKT